MTTVYDFPLWPGHCPLAEREGIEVRRGVDPKTQVEVIVFWDAAAQRHVAMIADVLSDATERVAVDELRQNTERLRA